MGQLRQGQEGLADCLVSAGACAPGRRPEAVLEALAGRWRLESQLGSGASGVTWRATDLASGEVVGVKEVPLRGGGDKARTLALREVEVLRQLEHPGIPGHRAHFVIPGKPWERLFLEMEFIPGGHGLRRLRAAGRCGL